MVLQQDERRRGVVRDVVEHIPLLRAAEHVDPLGRRLRGTLGRAGLHPRLALDAQPDQGADLGTQLDRFLLGQVAEVFNLEFAVGVLVDGERVDHPDGVAFAQPLQLGNDLTVKVGVVEPQDDELHRSNGHVVSLLSGHHGTTANQRGVPGGRTASSLAASRPPAARASPAMGAWPIHLPSARWKGWWWSTFAGHGADAAFVQVTVLAVSGGDCCQGHPAFLPASSHGSIRKVASVRPPISYRFCAPASMLVTL